MDKALADCYCNSDEPQLHCDALIKQSYEAGPAKSLPAAQGKDGRAKKAQGKGTPPPKGPKQPGNGGPKNGAGSKSRDANKAGPAGRRLLAELMQVSLHCHYVSACLFECHIAYG